jgi:outer membrane protein
MRTAFVIALALSSTAFADKLSVDDAVKMALRDNPRYRAAQERAGAAHDQASSVRGRLGFQVRLSEEYQHFDCPFAISFTTFVGGCEVNVGAGALIARKQDTNTFAALINQPLVGLLHTGYDFAAQSTTAKAADAGVATGEAAVRESVRAGFLRYFEAKALTQIAAASVKELEEQVKVARARLQAGVLTNADLLRVVVAQANARQQEIVAATAADVARANLLNVIGLPADDSSIDFEEPRTLLALAAQSLPEAHAATREAERRRPEMAQARLQMRAADKSRTARWLSLLPEVDAEGGYLRIDGQLFAPPDQWYVGVRANWAIWEWGSSFYQARAAGKLAQAAAFDAESQRRAVATEVQTGLSQTRAAGVAVEVAETAIASAEEAYRVTNALLQAGSATTTDLLDAQSALTTARLNLTRAQYERAIQRVSLGRVLAE